MTWLALSSILGYSDQLIIVKEGLRDRLERTSRSQEERCKQDVADGDKKDAHGRTSHTDAQWSWGGQGPTRGTHVTHQHELRSDGAFLL